MDKRQAAKNAVFFLLMLLATVIICTLMLELGVRAFFAGPAYLCTLYAKDDVLGYTLKPHAEMIIDFNYFKQNVSLNSYGLRDREYGPKDTNERRILALGDSFLFGAVWDANQTFVKVLERELNANTLGPKYSVVNTGVSGYGTFEEKEFLKRDGPDFEADTVLYFFYQNDIESDLGAPQSVVLPNGCAVSKASLALPLLSWGRLQNWLILHSRAYIYFRFILLNKSEALRNNLYKVRNILVDAGLAQPARLQYKILGSQYDQETGDGWNATLANIDEMAAVTRDRDQRFVMLMIPMKFQVYDAMWDDYRNRNRVSADAYDFGKPARILAEAAARNNVTFIDLTPLIKDAIRTQNITEPLYHEGDAHFNVLGNEVVGRILFERLPLPGVKR